MVKLIRRSPWKRLTICSEFWRRSGSLTKCRFTPGPATASKNQFGRMRMLGRWNFSKNIWQRRLQELLLADKRIYYQIGLENSDDSFPPLVCAVCALLAGGARRSGALSTCVALSVAVPGGWDRCTWRACVGARGHPVSRAASKRAVSHLIGEYKSTLMWPLTPNATIWRSTGAVEVAAFAFYLRLSRRPAGSFWQQHASPFLRRV